MKRVILFGGSANRPTFALNAFLTEHPNIELLDVKATTDQLNNIILVCTVNVPEDLSGLDEWYSKCFGFKKDESQTEQEANAE